MRIAHYYANEFMRLFEKHAEGMTFLEMDCDKDVDVIYCGSVSKLSSAIKAKQKYRKPLVCWVWDIPYNWREWGMDSKGNAENAPRDSRNQRNLQLLKKCDLVISSSKYTQSVLKDRYGVDSEQIYFYLDIEALDAVKVTTGGTNAIQISRYFYNKRFEDSIKSINQCPNRELVCIGYPQSKRYLDYLNTLAESNTRIYSNIPREETIRRLKQSALLVSPSVFEGWGMTVAEAIYCNIPVLVSDLGVFREVYGDTILYHKRFDVNEMSSQLERLFADKQLQKKIVNQSKPLIAPFTPSNFAKRWRKLIYSL